MMTPGHTRDAAIVLGATGMLGHQLVRRLATTRQVVAIARASPDPERVAPGLSSRVQFVSMPEVSAEEVRVFAHAHNARWILNAIGIIKQRPQATDPVAAIRINTLFPHELAAVCRADGIALVHISTDCVFRGSRGAYSEADWPDAQDLYGRSKALGEVSEPPCLTLRTSLIGPELGSRRGLLEWFRSHRGERVNGFRRVVFSGLPTVRMARLIEHLLDEHAGLTGLYHVAGAPISKFDLLQLINARYRLGITVVPTDDPVLDRSLDGRRFNAATGFRPEPWEELIGEMARTEETHAN